MSLLGKLEGETEIKAPASKFYEIFCNRPHHISNISGDKVQVCKLEEGEWGTVGSIIYWNYCHDGEAKVAKHLIEAVDEEKNMIRLKVLESEYEKLHWKCTFEATPKGIGSVVHCVLEYEKLHGGIPDSNSILHFCLDLCKDLGAGLTEDN